MAALSASLNSWVRYPRPCSSLNLAIWSHLTAKLSSINWLTSISLVTFYLTNFFISGILLGWLFSSATLLVKKLACWKKFFYLKYSFKCLAYIIGQCSAKKLSNSVQTWHSFEVTVKKPLAHWEHYQSLFDHSIRIRTLPQLPNTWASLWVAWMITTRDLDFLIFALIIKLYFTCSIIPPQIAAKHGTASLLSYLVVLCSCFACC